MLVYKIYLKKCIKLIIREIKVLNEVYGKNKLNDEFLIRNIDGKMGRNMDMFIIFS